MLLPVGSVEVSKGRVGLAKNRSEGGNPKGRTESNDTPLNSRLLSFSYSKICTSCIHRARLAAATDTGTSNNKYCAE
jgi:hypothetical protein